MNDFSCNTLNFTARIFHGLKSILSPGDTLPPRFLEYSICKAFGMDHVGDGNFYADGIKGNIQASIKTRMINPHVLKTKTGRNFYTHPEMFLGPHQNVKQNKWTGGLEIVQRRQALEFDDVVATPMRIGEATLESFEKNLDESYKRYNTTTSMEIIGVHGYDHTHENYLVGLHWQEYKHIPANTLDWVREGYGVAGYAMVDGVPHKVADRVNGNAKREATCFKEYKDLTKYQYSVNIQVPLPDPWAFNQQDILNEINNLTAKHDKQNILKE